MINHASTMGEVPFLSSTLAPPTSPRKNWPHRHGGAVAVACTVPRAARSGPARRCRAGTRRARSSARSSPELDDLELARPVPCRGVEQMYAASRAAATSHVTGQLVGYPLSWLRDRAIAPSRRAGGAGLWDTPRRWRSPNRAFGTRDRDSWSRAERRGRAVASASVRLALCVAHHIAVDAPCRATPSAWHRANACRRRT